MFRDVDRLIQFDFVGCSNEFRRSDIGDVFVTLVAHTFFDIPFMLWAVFY